MRGEVGSFPERLSKYRKSKGLTKQQLSYLIGCSDVAIGEWERGTKMIHAYGLKQLADYFEISMDTLWSGD